MLPLSMHSLAMHPRAIASLSHAISASSHVVGAVRAVHVAHAARAVGALGAVHAARAVGAVGQLAPDASRPDLLAGGFGLRLRDLFARRERVTLAQPAQTYIATPLPAAFLPAGARDGAGDALVAAHRALLLAGVSPYDGVPLLDALESKALYWRVREVARAAGVTMRLDVPIGPDAGTGVMIYPTRDLMVNQSVLPSRGSPDIVAASKIVAATLLGLYLIAPHYHGNEARHLPHGLFARPDEMAPEVRAALWVGLEILLPGPLLIELAQVAQQRRDARFGESLAALRPDYDGYRPEGIVRPLHLPAELVRVKYLATMRGITAWATADAARAGMRQPEDVVPLAALRQAARDRLRGVSAGAALSAPPLLPFLSSHMAHELADVRWPMVLRDILATLDLPAATRAALGLPDARLRVAELRERWPSAQAYPRFTRERPIASEPPLADTFSDAYADGDQPTRPMDRRHLTPPPRKLPWRVASKPDLTAD